MTHSGVLHVVTRDQRRGAESVAAQLVAELDTEDSHRLVALAAGPAGQAGLGIDALVDRPGQGPLVVARAIGPLARLLRAETPTVALAHGGQALQALVAARRLARQHVPIVWQRILAFPPGLTDSRVRRAMWARLANASDAVIALTPHTGHEVRSLGYSGPVAVIPNHRPAQTYLTPDPGTLSPLPPEFPASGVVFGFVGHMVDQKDPLRFVDVAAAVLAKHPEATAVMLGDGPLRPAVEQACIAAGIDDRVVRLGHVNDVRPALRAIDVVVSVSRSESMTGSLIEALMAGCAIVTVDVDGMDWLVPPSVGAVVASDTGHDVATAVSKIIDAPEDLAMYQAGARSHGAQFSTERIAPAYADVLDAARDAHTNRVQVAHDAETSVFIDGAWCREDSGPVT